MGFLVVITREENSYDASRMDRYEMTKIKQVFLLETEGEEAVAVPLSKRRVATPRREREQRLERALDYGLEEEPEM